jgi:hypothetical protein
MEDSPLGVLGVVPVVAVREERAVSGVGAPICDFFGVSRVLFLLELPKLEAELIRDFTVAAFGLVTFERLPAVMNSWRRAACGFIRRSGSQIRHFAMKSTKI